MCCANNPINAIDPDGKSTWVINNNDGTYRVVGGALEDSDPNIYVYTIEDGQLVRGESIGVTTSMTSFYDSDMNGGKGAWAVGSIITPNDQSGKQFLKDFMQNPPGIGFYMDNAKANQRYDFKRTNGQVKEYTIVMKISIEECLLKLRRMAHRFIRQHEILVISQLVTLQG